MPFISVLGRLISFIWLGWILASCANSLPAPSVETLDVKTGLTIASVTKPMAFIETGIDDLLVPDKQPSVFYLGPEEWDRSGDFVYVLWVQIAPGVGGHRIGDIRARGAMELTLDDGSVSLAALEQPVTAHSSYEPIPPVGQSAYFSIDIALLKRMASSHKILLNVRAADLSQVAFIARQETRQVFENFVLDRNLINE